MTRSRGFALLAVLWVTVALGVLAAGAVARARLDASSTGERILAMRARWAAEGCLAATLARLEAALHAHTSLAIPEPDTLTYANGVLCATEAYDPATRLNLDTLGPAIRARFDSILAARGDTDAAVSAELFTPYGDGRINLNTGPDVVIAALPGIGPEALRVVAEASATHRPLTDLNDLTSRLSPPARDLLLARYSELLALTTFQTNALVLTASAWTDGSPPAGRIEVLVVAAGDRAAVVRRRMW